MRTILILAAALVSSSAFAGRPSPVPRHVGPVDKSVAVSTELPNYQIDPKLTQAAVDGAEVTVDVPNGTVKLTFWTNTCPKNAMCIAGPLIHTYELPIVSNNIDECGSNEIIAKKDDRPVDGDLKQLTVHDNTAFSCESITKVEATEVTLETDYYDMRETNHVHTTSTFIGPALKPLKLQH
jgi:hypothetical protein